MLEELLTRLWLNIHRAAPLGAVWITESVPLSKKGDLATLRNSFFIFGGILLEEACRLSSEPSIRSVGGMVLKTIPSILSDARGVNFFMSRLGRWDDCVLSNISSSLSPFKGENLISETQAIFLETHPDFWRVLSPVIRNICLCDNADAVRRIRQLSSLLLKVDIDRGDLLKDHFSSYLAEEECIRREEASQLQRHAYYVATVTGVRDILHDFSMTCHGDIVPSHGPGAVAEAGVFGWQKYHSLSSDLRLQHLLRDGDARLSSFSPFPLGRENRTSRVIFVPKTWKKLRGISAEPAGLQYFQQGVFKMMNLNLKRSPLGRFLDLNDQGPSGRLALEGSKCGTFATIDLTSASDSVTRALVKDIIPNSYLKRWLFGTRSTHTDVDGSRIEISKFAPMGSATCFPLESLIFLGCSLLAYRRRDIRNYHGCRVFGDDIIVDTSVSGELEDILTCLGFSINHRKSFTSGDFRESCGVDAWRGYDITPLKIKKLDFSLVDHSRLSGDHHSRFVSLCNSLYFRGYKHLRSFLLRKVLSARVSRAITAERLTVFGDGTRGSVFSPYPNNFHLGRLVKYQTVYLDVVGWTPVSVPVPDEVGYFEWKLNASTRDSLPVLYTLEWFRKQDIYPAQETPRRAVMKLSRQAVDPTLVGSTVLP